MGFNWYLCIYFWFIESGSTKPCSSYSYIRAQPMRSSEAPMLDLANAEQGEKVNNVLFKHNLCLQQDVLRKQLPHLIALPLLPPGLQSGCGPSRAYRTLRTSKHSGPAPVEAAQTVRSGVVILKTSCFHVSIP